MGRISACSMDFTFSFLAWTFHYSAFILLDEHVFFFASQHVQTLTFNNLLDHLLNILTLFSFSHGCVRVVHDSVRHFAGLVTPALHACSCADSDTPIMKYFKFHSGTRFLLI